MTVTASTYDPVVEGKDSVSLFCEVDSNPESTVQWTKDGLVDVVGEERELSITPVNRHDTGTYFCVATNQLGPSTPQQVDVNVHCEFDFFFFSFYSFLN